VSVSVRRVCESQSSQCASVCVCVRVSGSITAHNLLLPHSLEEKPG
jgi:hypothetical protein